MPQSDWSSDPESESELESTTKRQLQEDFNSSTPAVTTSSDKDHASKGSIFAPYTNVISKTHRLPELGVSLPSAPTPLGRVLHEPCSLALACANMQHTRHGERVYVCICVHVCVCLSLSLYVYMYVCLCMCMYIHIHIYICTYVCAYVCMYV